MGNIKNIYRIHSSELKQDIEEMQGKIETLDIHKSILLKNTNIIGEKLPFISEFLKNNNGKKIIGISKENESVFARSWMNGILKSLEKEKYNVYYITDYVYNGTKISNVKYYVSDNLTSNNLSFISPLLLSVSDDYTILQAFTIDDAMKRDAIELIMNFFQSINEK